MECNHFRCPSPHIYVVKAAMLNLELLDIMTFQRWMVISVCRGMIPLEFTSLNLHRGHLQASNRMETDARSVLHPALISVGPTSFIHYQHLNSNLCQVDPFM